MSSLHSYIVSDSQILTWVHSRVTCAGGLVPHAPPSLLQPVSHPLCPRHPSNPHNCISVSSICPHVPASDRFTSWLSPFGIAQMNVEALHFPPKVIIHKRLDMAQCMLPGTLKNYAAGLSQFTNFCDDFHIPEVERMPASESLLCTFVTTCGAGSIGKGLIKSWNYWVWSYGTVSIMLPGSVALT